MFFRDRYLVEARKCTSYLAKIRSSFLCMLCDGQVDESSVFFFEKGQTAQDPNEKVATFYGS